MLSIVMREIRNYFYMHGSNKQIIADRNTFSIEDGIIKPIAVKLMRGQYFRLTGSIMNDGIYQVETVGDGYIDISLHSEDYPTWEQPTHWPDTTYSMGDRVTHNGIRWVSLVNSNQWEPGTEPWAWEKVDMVLHSLVDETFTGIIVPLAIPRDFLELEREIIAFHEKALKAPNLGQVQSESFGGYSYSMATGTDGLPATWKSVFARRLHPYRKMFEEKI